MEKAIEAIEARDRAFEGLKKIMAITEVVKNKCWWDTEVCPFYSEIRGFQDAGKSCFLCVDTRIDKERFFSILEGIALPDLLERVALEDFPGFEEKIEKDREEGKEEAYEELASHIDGLIKLKKGSK